eukprot:5668309-Amphidinium_carterae.2
MSVDGQVECCAKREGAVTWSPQIVHPIRNQMISSMDRENPSTADCTGCDMGSPNSTLCEH